ncbi:hypothetical protein KVV02_008284 [Mortierella alpina]|uniref:HNH nuclease domain-containing protein n=1 Tax=Mortierella alpina TaxID=64518 RepID=A0A9P8A140_MORAP|nr:hypothetical protein KVV02_008284 [Mortierella alpina]
MLRLSVSKTWSCHEDSPRTLATDSPAWRELRRQVLQRDNYACRSCGVRAAKYMVCSHIDGNPSNNDLTNLGINCPLCDSVRHCGLSGILNKLSLGISSMSQTDINRRTLQVYTRTRRVPSFSEVDRNAVIIAESSMGYAGMLLGCEDDFDYDSECDCCSIPHTFEMHKGFFKEQGSALMLRHIVLNRLFPNAKAKEL